jgi:hypothetical protein
MRVRDVIEVTSVIVKLLCTRGTWLDLKRAS